MVCEASAGHTSSPVPSYPPSQVGCSLADVCYSGAGVVASVSVWLCQAQNLGTFCFRNGQGSGESAAGELTASRNQVRTLLSTPRC